MFVTLAVTASDTCVPEKTIPRPSYPSLTWVELLQPDMGIDANRPNTVEFAQAFPNEPPKAFTAFEVM